jgi:hypothetical protein
MPIMFIMEKNLKFTFGVIMVLKKKSKLTTSLCGRLSILIMFKWGRPLLQEITRKISCKAG